jgi:hypothetical protein
MKNLTFVAILAVSFIFVVQSFPLYEFDVPVIDFSSRFNFSLKFLND